MKKTIITLFTIVGLAMLVGFTAQAESKGKEITIHGKACCAKCCLKEGSECQNVVQVEKDGKKTTYYLADNKVSKDFHDNVCKTPKKASATGTCKKVDGKLVVTCSKIELDK